MAIIKISEENGGIYAEEATPDPRTIYIGDELRAELESIEKQIKETEKEPDEILMPNVEKIENLKHLEQEKIRIKEILECQ